MAVCVLAAGCKQEAAAARATERGADPWVFYSTLDERPRMLTLALRKDVWAHYDPERAALYRVSPERVQLEGAVYNTHHGPQPRTRGTALLNDTVEQPWRVVRRRETIRPAARLLGHRFERGRAVLMYELRLPLGDTIRVDEWPEVARDRNGRSVLTRTFSHGPLPPDTRVLLDFNAPALASDDDVELTAKSPELRGTLTLRDEGETRLEVLLPEVAARAPSTAPGKPRTAEALIAANDCATCHNPERTAVGPSYREIAHYYRTTPETIAGLAVKIREGGAEQWGDVAMIAHLELDPAEAERIASYILQHYDPGDANGTDGTHPQGRDHRQQTELDQTELQPGVAIQVYEIGHPLAALPIIGPEATPNVAFAAATIDLQSASLRRTEPSASVFVRAQGYLRITDEGEYDFRVDHDGMAALKVDDKLLPASPWVSAKLRPGLRKVEITYASNSRAPRLALRWVPPSGRESLVPADRLRTMPVDEREVEPGAKSYRLEPGAGGDGKRLDRVHPSFAIQSVRPRAFKPMVGGMDFLPDGRLAISTWDARGAIYLLDVAHADPERIRVQRFADGLSEPLGLNVVEGQIYVLQKHELTKVSDRDRDGVADDYRTVSYGWGTTVNFHEFSFGLAYRDDYFYATLATAVAPGGTAAAVQNVDRGKVMRIDRRTGTFEFLASGLRTPNGIGFGPFGALFITDNEGDWVPANKLLHVKPGSFYGSYIVDPERAKQRPITPPVVWLPVDEIANSPSEPLHFNVGPYRDQLLYGDVTYGGFNRVVLSPVGDTYQGCVLPFTQGFEAGINRAVVGPDGAIYAGGIGNPGNWAQPGKLWYGLERLVYTGAPAFEMLDVRVRGDGLELTFTEPIRAGDAARLHDYVVQAWRYEPTSSYGGPKLDLHALAVESVHVSPDRRRVFVATRDLRPGYVVHLRFANPPVAESGRELWATRTWCTVNVVPDQKGERFEQAPPVGANALTRAEIDAGWKLLFDGKSLRGWRTFRKQPLAARWQVRAGELRTRGDSGPDLVTDETYEDFELACEWKVAPGANSGVFYRATGEHAQLWQNAVEMQVLDDALAEDRAVPAHRAGSAYDLYAPRVSVTRPADTWNQARIVARGPHVEHWLNGHLVVKYVTTSDEWKRQVAASKFAGLVGFGTVRPGQIGLQHHGSAVAFRNIKIRRLP